MCSQSHTIVVNTKCKQEVYKYVVIVLFNMVRKIKLENFHLRMMSGDMARHAITKWSFGPSYYCMFILACQNDHHTPFLFVYQIQSSQGDAIPLCHSQHILEETFCVAIPCSWHPQTPLHCPSLQNASSSSYIYRNLSS